MTRNHASPAPSAAPAIDPYDAWVIARQLTGMDVNGALQNSSKAILPLAEYLAAVSSEQRLIAWRGWLRGRTDADTIIGAIAAVDPTGPPPAREVERPQYKMRCAADIEPLLVEWLWHPRVPLGMLTLFGGDPKLGKSFVTLAMGAAVSRGWSLPGDDAPAGPGGIVVMSAEDDAARTIVPRLTAAGADLSRVHLLESVILTSGAEALPSLRTDMEKIEAAVARVADCRLIIVDPVSAYLGGVDDHKNAELRGVLSPLKAMAERTGAAVVLVTHRPKSGSTNSRHSFIGSIAYVGACRANFLFMRDPDDPAYRRVLICESGCNLAGDIPTLAYTIGDAGYGPTVLWERDPVAMTAEQALAKEIEANEDPTRRAEHDAVDTWLRDRLAQAPALAKDIEREGREAGFSKASLDRAKLRIGAQSKRNGFGKGSKCYWLMPDQAVPEADGEAPINHGDPP
jgi:hypothetical protein